MSFRTNRRTKKVFKIRYRPMFPDSLSDHTYDLSEKNWVQSTPHPHIGRPTINELNIYRKKKGLKPLSLEEVRLDGRENRLRNVRDLLRKKDVREAAWYTGINILEDEGPGEVRAVLEEQLAKLDSSRESDKAEDRYFEHVNSGKYDKELDK